MSLARVGRWWGSLWSFVRALSGEAAYDDHVAYARASGAAPLSRKEFYLDGLRRKYSGPNRCC